MKNFDKIDLHMHTTISDGTDTPMDILKRVKEAGINLFSVTDHDTIMGCKIIHNLLTENDPSFISGVEFSCRDENGKYHILGYGYNPDGESILRVTKKGHLFRMEKIKARIEFLKTEFGFSFPKEELEQLFALNNPGKPHIGNLMVKYGYANTKEEAIIKYINKIHFNDGYLHPEDAIEGILTSGGIPVLAHPAFGSGNQMIRGESMDRRLKRLTTYGLAGIECFYPKFSQEICKEMLYFAEKYELYVTAGSDYHGTNKRVRLGNTGIDMVTDIPHGMQRFLEDIEILQIR